MTIQCCSLYSILGTQPSADAVEIRKKYRQAALRVHPDKGGSPSAFHQLSFAFEVLSCPIARDAYDRTQHSKKVKVKTKSPASKMHSCKSNASQPKRPAQRAEMPPLKRARSDGSRAGADLPSLQQRMARLGIPLSRLRDVLQSMKAEQRMTALQSLEPRLKAALALFMETIKTAPVLGHISDSAVPKQAAALSRSKEIDNEKALNACSMYKPEVHIKALRICAHSHNTLEVSLDWQMILVQLRQALYTASNDDPELWEDPCRTYRICRVIFEENGTSEEDMGLGAFVYFRAVHWLPHSCTIISRIMPLAECLELHSRLLRARRTSWSDLRAEWVKLMQSDQQTVGKRKSLCEAEAIADGMRSQALKTQLNRAINSALKALDQEKLHMIRQSKKLSKDKAREERRLAKLKRIAVSRERDSLRIREKRWKERREWHRGSDLTMSDFIHGFEMHQSKEMG